MDLKNVSKTAKLNLTNVFAEAVILVGKPKSSLEYPPKPRRKQNKQIKISLLDELISIHP